jgi:hypothetical protein
MIILDFGWAVGVFIFLTFNLLIFAWVFLRKEKVKELSLDPKFTWFCDVCTYTYINTRQDVISNCPRCGSFNKKNRE